jgi:hypothetical protein
VETIARRFGGACTRLYYLRHFVVAPVGETMSPDSRERRHVLLKLSGKQVTDRFAHLFRGESHRLVEMYVALRDASGSVTEQRGDREF